MAVIARIIRRWWRRLHHRCVYCGDALSAYPTSGTYANWPLRGACGWCNKRWVFSRSLGMSGQPVERGSATVGDDAA